MDRELGRPPSKQTNTPNTRGVSREALIASFYSSSTRGSNQHTIDDRQTPELTVYCFGVIFRLLNWL